MTEPIRSLPSRYYTDKSIYAEEMRRIFARSWLCAGRLEQVRTPGDYLTCKIADEEVIVLRDGAGELRAFYNVCQHRAHRLLTGAGNRKLITCPYHAWTYELTGRLRRAPNQENVPGFDSDSICLSEVRVDTLATLVFVNLDADAPALRAQMAGLEEQIAAYMPRTESITCGRSETFALEANWKVVLENYAECYHCATAHPSFTTGIVEPATYRILTNRYYHTHLSHANADAGAPYAFDRDATEHGGEFASWLIWPLTAFQVYPGAYVNTFRWQPETHTRTLLHVDWYFPHAEPTEAEQEMVALHIRTTLREDTRLVAAVQQGLESRGYDRGFLMDDGTESGNSEHAVRAIRDLVLEALGSRL